MIRVVAFLALMAALFAMYKGAQLLLVRHPGPGIRRLAWMISAFWIGIPLLLMFAKERWQFADIDSNAWIAWALLAVVPNALFWAIIWILKGFDRS
ncbi:MAG TPA: hypothetical protein PLB10_00855 [Thiolinea sp.]|nr:hypothetical protein [Thiolinea sp.]